MSGDRKPAVWKNFVIGGSSGMFATCVIQPIDFVKVQIQIKGEGHKGPRPSPLAIAKETIAKYGVSRLYTGLSSALLRQATYTTARLGIYKTLMDWGNETYKGSSPVWLKGLFSISAGGLGAVVGNPADLALIRMQSDHTLPIEKRRNYTGVVNALTRIVKEEGFFSLWRGCGPTVVRAMALNFGMLGPYDQAKETLQRNFGNFQGIGITSSCIAAFFACLFSLPFDNVKTKFQKMVQGPDGQYPYKSFADCFKKSLAAEGALGLYVGFFTYVIRIAPHVVITLLTTDFLNARFNKIINMRFAVDFDLRLEQDSLRHLQYNGLTDPNLASFFASPVRRKLLVRQKLITPEGLVNEFIVRQNITKEYVTFPSSKKFSLTPLPLVRSKMSRRGNEKSDRNDGGKSGRSTTRNKKKERKGQRDNFFGRENEMLPKIQPISADKFKEILNNRRKLFL